MDSNIRYLNNKGSDASYQEIKTIIGWVLIVLAIYAVFYILSIYMNDAREVLVLRSYDIPYIPKNIQLKDKDNKVSRHLKFRFIYTCPESIFTVISDSSDNAKDHNDNNIQELFYFLNQNQKYVCFFVVNDAILSVPIHISRAVKCYPYKMYDTYVMGETRIFSDIEDILICQGVDRDTYGENCISTTYLNEICSNKMEYINYFMKHDLMIGTVIKPYKEKTSLNIYPGKYVKAPYSSRSACAAYEKLGEGCFLEDGVIVQEKNNMLNKYEIKCYVLDGKVEMTIVRLNGKNTNICIPDDYEGVSDDVKTVIENYKDEIRNLCKKAFYCINALTCMRIEKLKNDEAYVKYIINDLEKSGRDLTELDRRRVRYILTGLVNSEKNKLIDHINYRYDKKYDHTEVTKTINDYPDPIPQKVSYKIYDRLMRIDMALPDRGKYKKMTVTEIEPFASGIYVYKTIGACLKDDELNAFDNITKYNLYKIISSEKDETI